MRSVGAAEGVAGLMVEFLLYDFQIVVGNDDIRIQDDEILALATFGTIIARWPWARVRFEKVIQGQKVGIFLANGVASLRRTVLHYNDLKIHEGLPTKALQQLINFLRSIINRYDD